MPYVTKQSVKKKPSQKALIAKKLCHEILEFCQQINNILTYSCLLYVRKKIEQAV